MNRILSVPEGLICAIAALFAQPVEATIALNQLSACLQLHQFRAALDDAGACQAPPGRVATVLAERIRNWPGVGLCFRATSPTDLLNGFACTSVTMGEQSKSLLCFREIASTDIHDYYARNREVYDALGKDYLKRAMGCDAGNGDSSNMAPTMLPWIVAIVAEHKFGYVLPIGDRLVGSSTFIHGFGHLDPEIYADGDRYVEYVFTWRDRR